MGDIFPVAVLQAHSAPSQSVNVQSFSGAAQQNAPGQQVKIIIF